MESKDSTTRNESPNKPRFLSLSLYLLLQGEFISVMGDMIYEIGRGFWVLAFTGSTVIMGTLMDISVLPSVLLSPFAGVIVDRSNRKKLIYFYDFFVIMNTSYPHKSLP